MEGMEGRSSEGGFGWRSEAKRGWREGYAGSRGGAGRKGLDVSEHIGTLGWGWLEGRGWKVVCSLMLMQVNICFWRFSIAWMTLPLRYAKKLCRNKWTYRHSPNLWEAPFTLPGLLSPLSPRICTWHPKLPRFTGLRTTGIFLSPRSAPGWTHKSLA